MKIVRAAWTLPGRTPPVPTGRAIVARRVARIVLTIPPPACMISMYVALGKSHPVTAKNRSKMMVARK